jgi:integrase
MGRKLFSKDGIRANQCSNLITQQKEMMKMPVYKDNEKGTWYCQFYYEDWTGKRKKKYKRGFRTKKEAQEYESEFKRVASANMDMTVESFVDIYFSDKRAELKERTMRNKKYMINSHVIPYLGNKKMNEVTPSDIIAWQNEIRSKNFSDSYQRMLQNQVTALFTHAQKIYNLSNNPCKKVKKIGRSDVRRLEFWTYEEYQEFIATFEPGSRSYVIFEILFWTGMREGEMLALTLEDIDMENQQIHISKTYYRAYRKDIITEPKTDNSVRTIEIPAFLVQEIKDYCSHLYKYPKDERLFPIVAEAVQHTMKRHIEKAGVKPIDVHSLRHSHCAYLIKQGVQPLIIKERLGHKDIKITLNTYGHLYPSEQKKVASLLDNLMLDEKVNKKEDAPAGNKDISE